jgi:hypothetical protein
MPLAASSGDHPPAISDPGSVPSAANQCRGIIGGAHHRLLADRRDRRQLLSVTSASVRGNVGVETAISSARNYIGTDTCSDDHCGRSWRNSGSVLLFIAGARCASTSGKTSTGRPWPLGTIGAFRRQLKTLTNPRQRQIPGHSTRRQGSEMGRLVVELAAEERRSCAASPRCRRATSPPSTPWWRNCGS